MTTSMQHPETVQPIVHPDGGGTTPSSDSHLQMNRTVNPHMSVEDYSRVMLEYTHNRMASFADLDADNGSPVSRSSRSSAGSGKSDDSAGDMLRRGPAPTSAGVSHHDFSERGGRKATRDDEKKRSI